MLLSYKKPVRPLLVVASDKVASFNAQKRSPESVAERKRLVAMFRANNSDEESLNRYFQLLSKEMAKMYEISAEQAAVAIRSSAIQHIAREYPEYVDHVPLSEWAKEVYAEYFGS